MTIDPTYASGIYGPYTHGQQVSPAGFFGDLLGQVGQPFGQALGGLFGNRQTGSAIGSAIGGLGSLLPFNTDPVTAALAQQQYAQQQYGQQQYPQQTFGQQTPYTQQLNPAGWFGNLLGQVGQPFGSAIGGMFGNRQAGSGIGSAIGSLGHLLPFNVDPVTAAYAQQQQQLQQLNPAGWFGNLLGQVGQPLGGAIGGMFGNRQAGSGIGSAIGSLGHLLPFNVDPVTAAYVQQQLQQQQLQQQQPQQQQPQQQQLNPAGWFGNLLGQVGQPLGGAIGGMFGNRQVGSGIGSAIGGLGHLLPFNIDPLTAAYVQQQLQQLQQQQLQQQQPQSQQQLNPAGWFGNLLGQVGQPLGGAIGGMFGNRQAGSGIGSAIGSLGHLLPFNVDPLTAAYAQQQWQQPQTSGFGQPYPQQQQLAPAGIFGSMLGGLAGGLGGGALGGLLGNRQAGHQIGNVAGGLLGSLLPFSAPVTNPYTNPYNTNPYTCGI